MLVDVVYNVIQEFLIERESLFVKEVIDYSTPLPLSGEVHPLYTPNSEEMTTDILLPNNNKNVQIIR